MKKTRREFLKTVGLAAAGGAIGGTGGYATVRQAGGSDNRKTIGAAVGAAAGIVLILTPATPD